MPTDLAPLDIEPAYHFRRGQDVTVIGNPGIGNEVVLENAVSRGVMSTTAVFDGQNFLTLNIAINPGNSGGPVIDPSGKVIGVATLKAVGKEGIAFCVPVADLVSAIAQVKVAGRDATTISLMHRARYIAIKLDEIGQVYGAILDAHTKGMDRSVGLGLNPNLVIGLVRQEVASTLRKIDVMFTKDLYPEMNRVADDKRIARSIRDGLVNAWSVCAMMKSSIDKPKGSTDTYQADASMLKAQCGRVTERLRAELNLPNP